MGEISLQSGRRAAQAAVSHLQAAIRRQQLLQTLDAEASRARVGLDTVSYDPSGQRWYLRGEPTDIIDRPQKHGGVLGFLEWALGISSENLAGLSRRLSSQGFPIALLDEGDLLRQPANALGPPGRAAVFTVASSALAGIQVGNFLLSLGHRRIAFFSIYAGIYGRRTVCRVSQKLLRLWIAQTR